MRVTENVKKATRARILEACRDLFTTKGFAETTTRDLARAAGVANGTIFNYFPSKEAAATVLVEDALARGHLKFESKPGGSTLDEDLFSYVANGLREIRPYRSFIRAVLDASLGPIAGPPPHGKDCARARHLETAHELALKHGHRELSPLSLQLYWTLYTGVLTYWSEDASPHQEDTWALLDRSLRMFVGWLDAGSDKSDLSSGDQ